MFEADESFIDICNKNIELISQVKDDIKPVKLNSFSNFKKYEDEFFLQFNHFSKKRYLKYLKKNLIEDFDENQRTKLNIKDEKSNIPNDKHWVDDIPIVKKLSEHLYSKIFNTHSIVIWTSISENDKGTDWHTDFNNEGVPTYLICANIIGNTHWQFKDYDDIYMSAGDMLVINGSVEHKVTTKDLRVTLAGHSNYNNLKKVFTFNQF